MLKDKTITVKEETKLLTDKLQETATKLLEVSEEVQSEQIKHKAIVLKKQTDFSQHKEYL